VHSKKSAVWIYKVDPYEIHYLRYILEAYEGLATLTTLDPLQGLIQLAVPPGCEGSLETLMEALAQELELKRVSSAESS
jgi:hypothetical protein